MKKSLSVLVATAMVSSIFASSVFADDQLTTQQKYDALIAAGIFDKDGTGNGAELDSNMSREQLAKILVKLKGLEEVSGTSYTDVAADRWSAGFIQAVSKANPFLMDGVGEGIFDPSGEVTLEQLAIVAVRALGLQTNNSATVNGTVSDWAKGYVAAAIANGLLGQKADYTKPAIRSELVEAAYAAKEVLEELGKPGQVSVASAKATGVKKVEVKFDRDVDPAKAKLTLKKANSTIGTTVKFAEDNKSAILTLSNGRISAGEYTVTLSGLEEEAINKASASFTAEDEKLEKLEFANANEFLAYTKKAIVKLKAVNQYGESASVNPGEYNVYAGNNNDVFVKFSKNEDNDLLLTLNTEAMLNAQQNVSVIPVNIVHNTSRLSVSKTFKLGTVPFIQKMELSEPRYSNSKNTLSNVGETVTFDIFNYDQYGNLVAHGAVDTSNTQVNYVPYPFEGNLTHEIGDSNGDEVTDVKISLVKNTDKTDEYTVTIWNQAGTASAKISVSSAKVATKISLGQPVDTIAAGDEDAYVELTAFDAEGQELSVDDLVSNENVKRINISSSTGSAELVQAGEHKGKIKIKQIPGARNSVVSLNVSIATPNANSFDNKNYHVQQARYPEYIKVVTDPAKKILDGATSDFRFTVYDQYDKEYKKTQPVDSNGNVATGTGAGVSEYRVLLTTTNATYGGITAYNKVSATNFAPEVEFTGDEIGEVFNKAHSFRASELSDSDSARVRVVVQRSTNGGAWTDASTPVIREIAAVKSNEELTYQVDAVSALFGALDNKTVTDDTYNNPNWVDATKSKFAREVKVSAKDAAGNKVALPYTIKSITSSNPNFAQTALTSTKRGYVIGNKAGTANLSVSFETNKGETLVRSVDVNVKSDLLTVSALTVTNKTEKIAKAKEANANAFLLTKVKVTDNYGVAYEGAAAKEYNKFFGVVFSIENIRSTSGGTVKVDSQGNLTVDADVTSFELTANAGGRSATTLISND